MRYMVFMFDHYYPEGGMNDLIEFRSDIPDTPEQDGWEFKYISIEGDIYRGQNFQVYDYLKSESVINISINNEIVTENAVISLGGRYK